MSGVTLPAVRGSTPTNGNNATSSSPAQQKNNTKRQSADQPLISILTPHAPLPRITSQSQLEKSVSAGALNTEKNTHNNNGSKNLNPVQESKEKEKDVKEKTVVSPRQHHHHPHAKADAKQQSQTIVSPPPPATSSSSTRIRTVTAPSTSAANSSAMTLTSLLSTTPRLSIRVSDIRFDTGSASGVRGLDDIPPSSLWKKFHCDELNAMLEKPLSKQEYAIAKLHHAGLKDKESKRNSNTNVASASAHVKTAEDFAAEQAYRGIEVSRLVSYYITDFGTSVLGEKEKTLTVRLENVAGKNGNNTNNESLTYRFRLPHDYETSLSSWSKHNSSPTDEDLYHSAILDRGIITVSPRSGVLASGESVDVQIKYYPTFIGQHVLPILCQVRDGHQWSWVVRGETRGEREGERMPEIVWEGGGVEEIVEGERGPNDVDGGLKEEEETKESNVFTIDSSISATPLINPFLPPPIPPSYSHTFSSIPIGCPINETPVQHITMRNPTSNAMRWRIPRSAFDEVKRKNWDEEVFEVVDAEEVVNETTKESYYTGTIQPYTSSLFRFKFHPIELKRYEMIMPVYVTSVVNQTDSDADEYGNGLENHQEEQQELLQHLTLYGSGITPQQWSLESYPKQTTMPQYQLIGVDENGTAGVCSEEGQLATLSHSHLHYSDVPLFSTTSRILTLRSLVRGRLEYKVIHRVKLKKEKWNESLKEERRVREGFGEVEDDGEDDSSIVPPDASESLDLFCTPSTGFLTSHGSIQIRFDLHAGSEACVGERQVMVVVRKVDDDGEEEAQVEQAVVAQPNKSSTTKQLDSFGFSKTPSTSLTHRASIASSQTRERHLPDHEIVGVGKGFAGKDVRVVVGEGGKRLSNPANSTHPTSSLHGPTILRRAPTSEEAQATAHLLPSFHALQSVPARVTWFGAGGGSGDDASGVGQQNRRHMNVLHLTLHTRVLSSTTIESDATRRREAAAVLSSSNKVAFFAQAPSTEQPASLSSIEQRYWIPAVEVRPKEMMGMYNFNQQHPFSASHSLTTVIQDLLHQSISETSIQQSLEKRSQESIKFIDEIDGSRVQQQQGNKEENSGNSMSDASPYFRNLSSAILRETLFNLMVEASDAESSFGLDRPPPAPLQAAAKEKKQKVMRKEPVKDAQQEIVIAKAVSEEETV